ncbi:MAG: hypothetical protein JWO72_97 [Caulobacteraceae bacterium]|nr:hypothetical protein [Caulobacteraceae bacterium]
MAVVPNEGEGHAPVLTVTEARQGRRGRHMAWVLGISMALVVIGFASLWIASAPHLSNPAGQPTISSKADANRFQAPPPQPRQSETPQTTPTLKPGVGADGRR